MVCLLGDKNLQLHCMVFKGKDMLCPYLYEVAYHYLCIGCMHLVMSLDSPLIFDIFLLFVVLV